MSETKSSKTHKKSGVLVILAGSLLMLVLGTVHSFSVFLQPLEAQFEASRSLVSLTYSLALVTLTAVVLFGHYIFAKLKPAIFVFLACMLGVLGALVAGFANSLLMVWIGYGVLFGAANGLGYGHSLQISAQANPGHEGMAMGIITAAYALGATFAPVLYDWAVVVGGFKLAMIGLAGALLLVAPISALLMAKSGVLYRSQSKTEKKLHVPSKQIALLWLAYGAAVATGLMVIGHATGIVQVAGLQEALWLAPVVVAVFNMFGSFTGGVLVDRITPLRLLTGLPICSTLMLLALLVVGDAYLALLCLGLIGFVYGATIAVYPAIVAKFYGMNDSTRIYGKVFTAWGTFGLLTPWLAGYLFDISGEYVFALIIAAGLGVLSALSVVMWLKGEKA